MKITEYGITVVYLMILCRIAYADWKYQIIEPWTHIGILTLACMEMLFRVGVSVQERCLGAVVIAVPMLKAVCDAVQIPVIASGGAGKLSDFAEAFLKTGCSAALAASLFHFRELTVQEVKADCRAKGIPMR